MLGYVLPIKPKLTRLLSLPEDNFRETDRDSFLKANKIQCSLSDGLYIKDLMTKIASRRGNDNFEKDVLYFMMYYDDLEIVNAIGSSTGKHKLGI